MNKLTELIMLTFLMVAIDLIWLQQLSQGIYQKVIKKINNTEESFLRIEGTVAWIVMALGILYYVMPKITPESSQQEIFTEGMYLGLLVYGVYNTTNYAFIKEWTLQISITDTIWGGIYFGLVSVIFNYLKN